MLCHIVATDRNNLIGNQGDLPWHLPEDLRHFKKLTLGHTVIMGRLTFESIWNRLGKPLPGRESRVISQMSEDEFEGRYPGVFQQGSVSLYNEPASAISDFKGESTSEAFIIGGSTIYRQTLDEIDRIYFTRIMASFQGEAYYPNILKSCTHTFELLSSQLVGKHPYPFYFQEYVRI